MRARNGLAVVAGIEPPAAAAGFTMPCHLCTASLRFELPASAAALACVCVSRLSNRVCPAVVCFLMCPV
jgi:hypothetical protein